MVARDSTNGGSERGGKQQACQGRTESPRLPNPVPYRSQKAGREEPGGHRCTLLGSQYFQRLLAHPCLGDLDDYEDTRGATSKERGKTQPMTVGRVVGARGLY